MLKFTQSLFCVVDILLEFSLVRYHLKAPFVKVSCTYGRSHSGRPPSQAVFVLMQHSRKTMCKRVINPRLQHHLRKRLWEVHFSCHAQNRTVQCQPWSHSTLKEIHWKPKFTFLMWHTPVFMTHGCIQTKHSFHPVHTIVSHHADGVF